MFIFLLVVSVVVRYFFDVTSSYLSCSVVWLVSPQKGPQPLAATVFTLGC